MNEDFKQWLQKQEYAYNPKPREKGWMIWKVNRNMLLNSELGYVEKIRIRQPIKWKWDGIFLLCEYRRTRYKK